MAHLRATALIAFLFCAAQLLLAKQPPDLIAISGGGLRTPIDINDPVALKSFSPYSGFFDGTHAGVDHAPCAAQSYDVRFYMRWPERTSAFDRGDLKMVYGTRYCTTDKGGWVYFPARGEPMYRENNGTIIRASYSGKWLPAAPRFDLLLRTALGR